MYVRAHVANYVGGQFDFNSTTTYKRPAASHRTDYKTAGLEQTRSQEAYGAMRVVYKAMQFIATLRHMTTTWI